MAGVDKIVDKMKRQPNNISFPEAKKVLEKYGYEEKGQKAVTTFLKILTQKTGCRCLDKAL